MPLAPVQKITAAVQIAEAIREALFKGEWRPGERLPSERDLARTMGVNRSTIREALHRLEANGLVEIRQGGATRVRDFLVTAGLQLLPVLIAPRGSVDPAHVRDLLEIRTMILGWTARTVARARPSAEQLVRLEALAEELADGRCAPERRQLLDFEFFEQLVRLSPNQILRLFVAPVREVYLEHRALFAAIYADERFVGAFHRLTVEAIRRGDERAAAAAMEAYGETAMEGEGDDRAPTARRGFRAG